MVYFIVGLVLGMALYYFLIKWRKQIKGFFTFLKPVKTAVIADVPPSPIPPIVP